MNSQLRSTSSSDTLPSPVLLQGGQIIQGGRFVQHNEVYNHPPVHIHVCAKETDGFQHLQAHVATAAYDAKDKVDAPKCHPNTRQVVIHEIMSWILEPNVQRSKWILWLNGAAGAGKSAIARSIFELCAFQNVIVASFFFFRADSTRNSIDSVVATLVYQLIQSIPDLKWIVASRLSQNPLIFKQSLHTQFITLLLEPLQLLQHVSKPQCTVVILLDGLDELSGDENQADLIGIMAEGVSSKPNSPIVFFGSRTEYQIRQSFASRPVSDLVRSLPLDNNYMAQKDIHLFLNDSFAEIKAAHPNRHLLDPAWPAPAHVQHIVERSSGQFIYAAVVVKFVSMPKMHPAAQLNVVRGLGPAGAVTPFAQLDALYRHIFSQVESLDQTMYILAAQILCESLNMTGVYTAFQDCIPASSIPFLLAGLASVVTIRDNEIQFLHASLPEFLLDQSLASVPRRQDPVEHTAFSRVYEDEYTALLKDAHPTKALQQRLATVYPLGHSVTSSEWIAYLSAVQALSFGDAGGVYQLQLENAVKQLMVGYPEHLARLDRHHNISRAMEKVLRDKAVQKNGLETSPAAQRSRRDVGDVAQEPRTSAGGNDAKRLLNGVRHGEDHESVDVGKRLALGKHVFGKSKEWFSKLRVP